MYFGVCSRYLMEITYRMEGFPTPWAEGVEAVSAVGLGLVCVPDNG